MAFEFTAVAPEEIESSRRVKTVTRDSARVCAEFLTAFNKSGLDAGGKFTWTTLPEELREKYEPAPMKGNSGKIAGGMNALVIKIKSVQDKYDVYPVPMSDEAIHELNEANGEDIPADDRRYGGFILVRKSFWKNRNNKTTNES